jgi:hypothetical protein
VLSDRFVFLSWKESPTEYVFAADAATLPPTGRWSVPGTVTQVHVQSSAAAADVNAQPSAVRASANNIIIGRWWCRGSTKNLAIVK